MSCQSAGLLRPRHAKLDGAALAADALSYRLQTVHDHVRNTHWQMPGASLRHHPYVQKRKNTYCPAIGFQHQVLYVTPRLRTKFGERAFLHAGPAAWNSLPPDIHAAASPAIFKKLLKMHFLT